jgi:glucosylceramidase
MQLHAVLFALIGSSFAGAARGPAAVPVRWFSTTNDMTQALTEQSTVFRPNTDDVAAVVNVTTILIDDTIKYQTIRGIGASLESSTAFNMMRMSSEDRADLIHRLFDPIDGIGFNLMRVTIGTSDFCILPFYSYDDLAENETGAKRC